MDAKDLAARGESTFHILHLPATALVAKFLPLCGSPSWLTVLAVLRPRQAGAAKSLGSRLLRRRLRRRAGGRSNRAVDPGLFHSDSGAGTAPSTASASPGSSRDGGSCGARHDPRA